jgi:hypothetical protein
VTVQEAAIAAEFSTLDSQEQRQLIALLRKVERRLADRT